MAEIFYDNDVSLSAVQALNVAIVGYDIAARAHALNLRDSGVAVIIGLPGGAAEADAAREDGFIVKSLGDAAQSADVVALLLAKDEQQAAFAEIASYLTAGKTLVVSAGFNLHYGVIAVPHGVDAVLVQSQGAGEAVRAEFNAGRGIPALIAVHADASGRALETAKSYAAAVGAARAGVVKSTVAEIVETGLFGEQAVFGGGLRALLLAGFDALVQAGYQSEVAYLRAVQQVQQATAEIAQLGFVPSGTNAAKYGSLTGGARVIDAQIANNMQAVLADIRSGAFATRFNADQAAGGAELRALEEHAKAHQITGVAAEIRKLFP